MRTLRKRVEHGGGRLILLVVLGALGGCAATPSPQSPEQEESVAASDETIRVPSDEAPPSSTDTDRSTVADAKSGTNASPAASETASSPGADDGLDADIAALSASTGGDEPKAKPAASAPSSREIVYRVTPKGLVIELDGLHLRPEAKPVKDKNGAYGVELVVNAESFDGRQYWVNKPAEGPLSIAGKIESKDGKSSRFADERKGDGEEVVTEGAPRSFRQSWPGRGQPKLWWGQTVTLEIGLWGVRAEANRERPVRRLFVVKMVGGNKPQAVITPPTMDWGS